jgi:hypothetical protein
MADSSVENLDDEELLMYYETTKKFLGRKIKEGKSQNGKVEILQQKLAYIEDELKSRSLWEAEYLSQKSISFLKNKTCRPCGLPVVYCINCSILRVSFLTPHVIQGGTCIEPFNLTGV